MVKSFYSILFWDKAIQFEFWGSLQVREPPVEMHWAKLNVSQLQEFHPMFLINVLLLSSSAL